MKKSDLRTGMQVEDRDGKRSVILLGTKHGDVRVEVGGSSWGELSMLNENLTHTVNKSLDVLKVYENSHPDQYLIKEFGDCHLIWEREEEEIPSLTMKEAIEKIGFEFTIKE